MTDFFMMVLTPSFVPSPTIESPMILDEDGIESDSDFRPDSDSDFRPNTASGVGLLDDASKFEELHSERDVDGTNDEAEVT